MGFRRLTFLLSVTFALALVACGDNLKPAIDDASIDAVPDAPDAMPDALMCGAAPNMICNGACANTDTDEMHCGSCTTACTTGQTCDMGVCCDAGEENCGGTCYPTQTDHDHCGGCDPSNMCTSTQTCMNGTCCGGGNTVCGTMCFDLETNNNNCGACDNICGQGANTGKPSCTSGHCCATGQTWCGPDVGGACVDLNSDEANCGACAGDPGAELCNGSTDTCCGGNCVDVDQDEANCGACSPANGSTGDVCLVGTETCDTGVCCTNGTIHCTGSTCVDPTMDEGNCGGCISGGGELCDPGETCTPGSTVPNAACCPPGTINCSGTCIDPLTDNDNCGNCAGASNPTGTDCASGICSGGQCATGCGPGESNCNGDCVDTNSDNAHCGTAPCGVPCAANQICDNGTCSNSTMCSGTETLCAGDCVNTNTDPNHCGGCSNICGPSDECVNGACQLDCQGSDTFCAVTSSGVPPNACYDLLTDERTCGACNTPCAAGSTCYSGMCCPSGQIRCGNSCVNPTNDPGNCGGCATGAVDPVHICDSGEQCKPTGQPLGGVCCNTSDVVCSGACSDTTSDEGNCGACASSPSDPLHVCDSGETCLTGLCCLNGQSNVMGMDGSHLCCTTGNLNCNINGTPTCINQLTDHDNCGSCGNDCGTDVCVNGNCEATCDPPLETTCGTCANSDYDPNFCATGPLLSDCKKCASGGATCADSKCRNTADDDADGRVNDGCPASGTPEVICNEAVGSAVDNDGDGFVNDGCAAFATSGTPIGEGDEDGENASCACPSTAPTVCGASGNNPGTCVNTQTSDTNCGSCNNNCTTTGKVCTSGLCCAPGQVRCGNACVDLASDELNCGACAGTCTGGSNNGNPCGVAGDCPSGTCTGAQPNAEVCKAGQVCSGGDCDCPFGQEVCGGSCKTLAVDPDNCGTCGNDCGTGANAGKPYCVSNGCTSGCPAPLIPCGSGSSAKCVNPDTDSTNCGGCAGAGGVACANNQLPNGQGCVDGGCVQKLPLTQDPTLGPLLTARCVGGGPPIIFPNDGGGTTCAGNLAATAFTFGMCSRTQVDVPAQIFTDAFNSNFGPYRAVGASGANQACSAANVCAYKCVGGTSAGLACTSGANCPGGTCPGPAVGGACGNDLACTGTCIGGSNPGTTCVAGSTGTCLAGGICGNAGNCQSADCAGGLMCLGAPSALDPKTCVGGGVGINGGPTGLVNPLLKTQQTGHVGGSFWAFGTIGLDIAKTIIVKEALYNEGPFKYASNGHKVYGDAYINGPFSTQGGQAAWDIDGKLTYDYTGGGAVPCPPPGTSSMTVGASGTGPCVDAIWDQALLAPCGEQSDLTKAGGWDIPVSKTLTGTALPPGGIVEYFRDPAHNDNKAIGLRYNAISAATGDVRLDLPCGYYYLDSLTGSNKVTIVVSGRVAIFVGGNADINVEMQFDVQPTGSLDLFVGGVINIAHSITLGSPAYPRLTRMYIGRAGTAGSGSACTTVSDCGSGVCSACAGVNATWSNYGACTGTGTCTGGNGRSPSINMSQGGFFNGLLWAGYGGFSTLNNVEMYGSIFADLIGASGDLKVHYDNGAAAAVDECPPPPPGTTVCESCRDCGNQPCGANNLCASGVIPGQPTSTCTAHNQCCPPLHCDIGSTNRCIL